MQMSQLTQRERRFIKFASVEYDGQLYMTPQDFLDSVTETDPRRKYVIQINCLKFPVVLDFYCVFLFVARMEVQGHDAFCELMKPISIFKVLSLLKITE